MRGADALAVGPVRRDKCGDDHEARLGEQRRDLADAADVLGAVLGREAEVGRQALAHVVAVERVDLVAAREEGFLELDREGALARAREAGEPEDPAAVAVGVDAVFFADAMGNGEDVFRFGH